MTYFKEKFDYVNGIIETTLALFLKSRSLENTQQDVVVLTFLPTYPSRGMIMSLGETY